MVGLVFGYKMIAGRNILALDIGVFFLVITLGQILFVLVLQELTASPVTIALSAVFLVGLLAAFGRFTANPPAEPDVFVDPINRKYGLSAHEDRNRQPPKRSR